MKYKYISSIFIIISILMITTITIMTPDKESSVLEGRTLEVLPLPTFIRNKILGTSKLNDGTQVNEVEAVIEANELEERNNNEINKEIEVQNALQIYINQILNGEYFKRWDTYFSDHMIFRDYMVNSYMKIQNIKHSKYINGVYIGENEMLFSKESFKYSNQNIVNQSNKFNDFAKQIDVDNVYLGLVPSKQMIESEKFPIKDVNVSHLEIIDNFEKNLNNDIINVINFSNLKSNTNVFYNTDHHLNSKGAYLAYKDIINTISLDFNIEKPLEKNMFEIQTFKECFIGADGRKVGYLVENLEDVIVYSPKNINYKAFDNGIEYSLIDRSQISKERFNNDYTVFMGGDKGRVDIENKDSQNDLSILIISDSIDNAIIPMLVPHFNKIYNFDLRNNNINIINEINSIKPDIVLLLGLPGGYLDSTSEIFRFN